MDCPRKFYSRSSHSLKGKAITKIGERCPQLQSLNLRYCSQVTDVGITKIGEGYPQLQFLDICFCEQLTDVGVSNLLEGCSQLKVSRNSL